MYSAQHSLVLLYDTVLRSCWCNFTFLSQASAESVSMGRISPGDGAIISNAPGYQVHMYSASKHATAMPRRHLYEGVLPWRLIFFFLRLIFFSFPSRPHFGKG